MANILTYRARIEQIKARLWKTLDNQVIELDNGKLLYLPRYELTDNNSNPFGDNDLSDVRASHFHDLFCYYHCAIYLNLTREDLINKRYLNIHFSKEYGSISVCENIPVEHFEIVPISFNEANNLFKQILLACDTKNSLANLMRFAVGFNLGWFKDSLIWNITKRPPKLDLSVIYKKPYGGGKKGK